MAIAKVYVCVTESGGKESNQEQSTKTNRMNDCSPLSLLPPVLSFLLFFMGLNSHVDSINQGPERAFFFII